MLSVSFEQKCTCDVLSEWVYLGITLAIKFQNVYAQYIVQATRKELGSDLNLMVDGKATRTIGPPWRHGTWRLKGPNIGIVCWRLRTRSTGRLTIIVEGWCRSSFTPRGAKLFRHHPWSIMVDTYAVLWMDRVEPFVSRMTRQYGETGVVTKPLYFLRKHEVILYSMWGKLQDNCCAQLGLCCLRHQILVYIGYYFA